MGTIASQITSLTIVYSTVYSDADQRKYQSSAALAFVWGIHCRPVHSPHKWPVTRKMFPFGDVTVNLKERVHGPRFVVFCCVWEAIEFSMQHKIVNRLDPNPITTPNPKGLLPVAHSMWSHHETFTLWNGLCQGAVPMAVLWIGSLPPNSLNSPNFQTSWSH